MPSSPATICRSCNSRAIGNGYCERHQDAKKEQKRLFDRFRADDPIRKLYKCKRWQRVRLIVLRRDILCQMCSHQAATEADHILSARLVLDEFGLNEFYNPDRLQGLCHNCHSKKTTMESCWLGKRGTKITDVGDRHNTTVVCGQPGSGKTTYVARFKAPNDLTWDYDVIMASITGLPLHQSLPGAVGSVLANRDSWIEATRYSTNHCWLIVSNPKAVVVQMMRDAGATVIVLDTPDDECQQHLHDRRITDASQ